MSHKIGLEVGADPGPGIMHQVTGVIAALRGNILSVEIVEEKSPELVAELVDRLEKAAVPYVIEAGTAVAMLGSESIVFAEPQPWEARVYVADAFGDRALEILRKVDQEFGRRRNLPL